MTKNYDLMIFDCDGTLTDTENINNQAVADLFVECGMPQYDLRYCITNWVGLTMTAIKKIVEEKEGVKLPDDFIQKFINRVSARIEMGLQPVKGAVEAVHQLEAHYKVCVASNGERTNVIESIKSIGLYESFTEQHIFTRIQVPRGKPYPDLFLYAAECMDVEPSKCLVIEDSAAGVEAGVAAGMDVIGITAVHHAPDQAEVLLKKIGAMAVFDTWSSILNYINKPVDA